MGEYKFEWDPEIRDKDRIRWVWLLRFMLIIMPTILLVVAPPPNSSRHTYRSSPMPVVERNTGLGEPSNDIYEDPQLIEKIQKDMIEEQKKFPHYYSEDDLFCLAVAIGQEAGGDAQSDYTRELVGRVIINRVNDHRFPNSIRAVITARNQYGKLHYTGVKFPEYCNDKVISRAYKIARIILSGQSTVECPPNVIWQSSFKQGDGVFIESDGIYFCYSD